MKRILTCDCGEVFEWSGIPTGHRFCRYTCCPNCKEAVRVETPREIAYGHPDLDDSDSKYTPEEIEAELKAKALRVLSSKEDKPIHSEIVKQREAIRRKKSRYHKSVILCEILIIMFLVTALMIWLGTRH